MNEGIIQTVEIVDCYSASVYNPRQTANLSSAATSGLGLMVRISLFQSEGPCSIHGGRTFLAFYFFLLFSSSFFLSLSLSFSFYFLLSFFLSLFLSCFCNPLLLFPLQFLLFISYFILVQDLLHYQSSLYSFCLHCAYTRYCSLHLSQEYQHLQARHYSALSNQSASTAVKTGAAADLSLFIPVHPVSARM